MNRLATLHNKTQDVPDTELPFNSANVLLDTTDLRAALDAHGLQDVAFHNINLFRNAFVHRSYCTMKNDDFESGNARCPADCLPLQDMAYERLEFVGDAILGNIIAAYLYDRYPDSNEGFLSKMRTRLVNGKMLGHLATRVGFPKFAILSKQVEDVSGRQNYKIMEDIFEAFIGALFMDAGGGAAGYAVAERWVHSIIETYVDFTDLIQSRTQYKDLLVRYMQHTHQDVPRFMEAGVHVENNVRIFTYCVKDRSGLVLGRASGASKKDAENLAAREALKYYGQPTDV
jgi:ribonuclease-3